MLTLGNFIIKARAFKTGAQSSNVVTAAYSVSGEMTPGRLAAGDAHSLALRDDGAVCAWGGNSSGQLGMARPHNG